MSATMISSNLYHAIEQQNLQQVEAMSVNGISPFQVSGYQEKPLEFAIRRGCPEALIDALKLGIMNYHRKLSGDLLAVFDTDMSVF